MRVYRVEDRNGYGPYMGGNEDVSKSLCFKFGHAGHRNDTPSTFMDRGIQKEMDKRGDLENYIHGFYSIESLKRWFKDDERNLLNEHEYKITIYECDRNFVRIGRFQTIFDPSQSEKIGSVDINEVDEIEGLFGDEPEPTLFDSIGTLFEEPGMKAKDRMIIGTGL